MAVMSVDAYRKDQEAFVLYIWDGYGCLTTSPANNGHIEVYIFGYCTCVGAQVVLFSDNHHQSVHGRTLKNIS